MGNISKLFKNFLDTFSTNDTDAIFKPEPRAEETREDFINRFMADEEALEDFPDEEQRYEVALSYWEDYIEGDNPDDDIDKAVPTLPDYPLASRDRTWDMEDAVGAGGRVRQYIGNDGDFEQWDSEQWAQFRQAHLWYDEQLQEQIGGYKLPYVDIIDGEPHIIPSAVFTIAGVLQGAMGGVDIPADDEDRVRARVEELYDRMAEEFDDEQISVPWNNPIDKDKYKYKKFKAWRCDICGYVYLGYKKPDRCAHCGVKEKYLVIPKDYIHYEQISLSEVSAENTQKALELEAYCESVYRCMADNAENRISESYFRRLARHEEKHKDELAEMMGVEIPDLPDDVECAQSDKENFMLAYMAERKAIEHYKTSIMQASEDRLIKVFKAFIDVEKEHKKVATYYIKKPTSPDREDKKQKKITVGDVNVPSPLQVVDVPPYGDENASIAFIGASPSDKDVLRKEPLTGKAGKIFKDKYLEPLGLSKEDTYIINLVPVAKHNKYGYLRQPTNDEIISYSDWFISKIKEVNPKYIVALGNKAYRHLLKDADFKLPHPVALYKMGDFGEVDRKIKHVKKSLEDNKGDDDTGKVKKKIECKIVKSIDDKQIIYGVVLEPDTIDAHNDIMSAEEIEKSCHFYMLNSQTIGLSHKKTFSEARILESYIAPVSFKLGKGNVKKGSWVMAVKILDNEKWKKIKRGDFTGFSIGAMGKRVNR